MSRYDYGRHAGFMYQELLSLYIHILFKEKYKLNASKTARNEYKEFRNNIKNFKQDILHLNFSKSERTIDFKKINNTKDKNLDILLEGDGNCFDDINILKLDNGSENDIHIFIQVKAKGEHLSNFGKNDGILDGIKNFQKNINFQNYKDNGKYMFFIFINKGLTKNTDSIINKTYDGYLLLIDHIINENASRTRNQNNNLPTKKLKKLNSDKHLLFIKKVLNGSIEINDRTYYKDEQLKLYNLILDLKYILSNLKVIKYIKTNILQEELEKVYGGDLGNEVYIIQKKSGDITPIKRGSREFVVYEKYQYTFYKSNDNISYGGKKINDLNEIERGKFI